MPVHHSLRPPERGGRRSAVLVLFAETADGPDVLLIQRNTGLRRHSGQPAFPGGAIDPSDGGPVDCALREAAEETGLDPAGVTVLDVLPELYISRSGFRVTPVLGWWHEPSDVRPVDTGEVAAVARVPIRELADPANRVRARHPNGAIGPAFRVRGMLVWGFTAGILNQLLVLGGWERPWLDGTAAVPVDALPPAAPGAGVP
ncbi:NUDIX hydrolase [Marinitenerispora sediminis]|uniref:Coenzyme A pyrophosphatase n=1 Tax=Marinitenerispora sediminis TaxID=1931232 RepID=A0A368T4P4_9ACTN|nr:CoA pyrophosphatase [Marinitenerispora sediminis]RCV49853.1 coenzyme A pyrophosphatase [Marinitenerispora sediminis]RCV53928.1 coenzyme A pyrophosphatase [Marinitenerispora sediminis]RCV58400.1 coenzyme A pyrophosphatase [Marinitenerispora sediminis]